MAWLFSQALFLSRPKLRNSFTPQHIELAYGRRPISILVLDLQIPEQQQHGRGVKKAQAVQNEDFTFKSNGMKTLSNWIWLSSPE